ncbi:MAG: O-antigen ligase family protein [Candidatus Omnitrophota bacterium]
MSFILLLLYISAIYIRPQEWVSAIYGWPLINILAILTAICVFFEAGMKQRLRLKEPHMVLLLAFLGAIAMSHLSHAYFGGAWESVLKFSANVIMFFLFINVLDSEKKIKIAIWFLILLTLILAAQGIYQWHNGIGWAGQPILQCSDEGRDIIRRITWVGIFEDPNDLALALVVAAGFLVSFIFSKANILLKIISAIALAVLMQALYYTNSRGGYLAMAATVGFFFLLRMKNKILASVIGGILAFAVIIVGPARMSQITAAESSAFGRIDAWFEGFQMLKSAPMFGVGYGMFTDYHSLTAHNSYILVAAEEGLVGFFIWIAIIYVCFKGLFKSADKKNELSSCISGIETGLFGFLCASYFLSRSYVSLFYIILALASAAIFTSLKKEEYAVNFKDMRLVGALTMGILAITWLSTRVSLRLFG